MAPTRTELRHQGAFFMGRPSSDAIIEHDLGSRTSSTEQDGGVRREPPTIVRRAEGRESLILGSHA